MTSNFDSYLVIENDINDETFLYKCKTIEESDDICVSINKGRNIKCFSMYLNDSAINMFLDKGNYKVKDIKDI